MPDVRPDLLPRLDETTLAGGGAAEAYLKIWRRIADLDGEGLDTLTDRGRGIMHELGVTFALYDDEDARTVGQVCAKRDSALG